MSVECINPGLIAAYLKVAREKVLHQWNGPLLESFRKHGVVGVSEGLLHNFKPLE